MQFIIEYKIIRTLPIDIGDIDRIGDKNLPMLIDTVEFVNIPILINTTKVISAGISPIVFLININSPWLELYNVLISIYVVAIIKAKTPAMIKGTQVNDLEYLPTLPIITNIPAPII